MACSSSPKILARVFRAGLLLTFGITGQIAQAEGDGQVESNDAKNLARINCGARISWISNNGVRAVELTDDRLHAAADLLRDDNTLSCHMTSGAHAFLITLPNISTLDRLTFINETAEMTGAVHVSVSNYRLDLEDSHWATVGHSVNLAGHRFIKVPLSGIEAKYLKVSFTVEKPGTVAGLGLYGQRTLESFAEQRSRSQSQGANIAYTTMTPMSQNNLEFNYANLYASARVAWVSSGSRELVRRMIDDDTATSFDFAPDDPHPTAVVELAGGQRLRRVSAVYEMQPGRLDIYLMNQLPRASELDSIRPVVSVTDQAGSGKAAAEFDPRGARYVVLRWTPSSKVRRSGGFTIAEIGAFSDLPVGIFNLEALPEQLAQSTLVTNPPVQPPVIVAVSP